VGRQVLYEDMMTKRPEPVELQMIAADGIPQSFRWRGNRYIVQNIVMHWVEVGPWWQALSQAFVQGTFCDVDSRDVTWHIWRVEARSMAGSLLGDIAQRVSLTSASVDPWRMIRVLD